MFFLSWALLSACTRPDDGDFYAASQPPRNHFQSNTAIWRVTAYPLFSVHFPLSATVAPEQAGACELLALRAGQDLRRRWADAGCWATQHVSIQLST